MYTCICTILCCDALISHDGSINTIQQSVKNQNIKMLEVKMITKYFLFGYCLNTESPDL